MSFNKTSLKESLFDHVYSIQTNSLKQASSTFILTSHGVKQLVGLKVSECVRAAGAAEGGSVSRVPFVRLNASAHVVQLVLHHINQQPVVNEIVIVSCRLAVRCRLYTHSTFDKLVSLECVQNRTQLLAVELEQFQHVLFTYAWVPDQHIQSESMLDAIKTSYNLLGQPFQRCRDLCEQLWFSHDEGEGKSRTKRGKDGETEQKQEVEVFSRPITKCL